MLTRRDLVVVLAAPCGALAGAALDGLDGAVVGFVFANAAALAARRLHS